MTDPLAWTGPKARVLRILADADEPLWPLGLAKDTGMTYGTVYGTCRRLYDRGWAVGITETKHTGRPARVLYRLTEEGRRQTAHLRTTTNEEN